MLILAGNFFAELQMFDDSDHGGGPDGDHDGHHGGGVDDDVALVARRPKQQCGSDDSSSTSGLPESHFPPFSSTMDLLTFSSLFFSHFIPLYSGQKDSYRFHLQNHLKKNFNCF